MIQPFCFTNIMRKEKPNLSLYALKEKRTLIATKVLISIKTKLCFNIQVDSIDGGSMYSVLVDVVKFISKSLCFENSTWMLCFGKLTWPRMSDLIVSNFLSKVQFNTLTP